MSSIQQSCVSAQGTISRDGSTRKGGRVHMAALAILITIVSALAIAVPASAASAQDPAPPQQPQCDLIQQCLDWIRENIEVEVKTYGDKKPSCVIIFGTHKSSRTVAFCMFSRRVDADGDPYWVIDGRGYGEKPK